jgi:hypothetical protein
MRVGLAFWKNGYTTPPFFEVKPYTWKCEIFHFIWSLEISFFFFLAKFRIHLDLYLLINNFNTL